MFTLLLAVLTGAVVIVAISYVGSMLIDEYQMENGIEEETNKSFPPDWSDDLRGML